MPRCHFHGVDVKDRPVQRLLVGGGQLGQEDVTRGSCIVLCNMSYVARKSYCLWIKLFVGAAATSGRVGQVGHTADMSHIICAALVVHASELQLPL